MSDLVERLKRRADEMDALSSAVVPTETLTLAWRVEAKAALDKASRDNDAAAAEITRLQKVVKSTPLYAHPPAKREAGETPPPQSHLMGGTAEQERLRFEGDLDKWMKIIGAGITGYQPEAYALMDLACEELVRLRKAFASLDWYWPEDDTSSDACADGPWQIAENCDVKPGEVFGYSRGGVVETRYYGFLEAAEDADSDDQFEADEPTREAAEAKIAAELQRRAALATTEGLAE